MELITWCLILLSSGGCDDFRAAKYWRRMSSPIHINTTVALFSAMAHCIIMFWDISIITQHPIATMTRTYARRRRRRTPLRIRRMTANTTDAARAESAVAATAKTRRTKTTTNPKHQRRPRTLLQPPSLPLNKPHVDYIILGHFPQ